MSYKVPVEDEEKLKQQKFLLQQWLYALVGIFTMIPILLLTIAQIRTVRANDNQLAIYLLLFVHSVCVLISILLTAFRCRITDALLTILTILLLFAYTGLHFYIRFLFDRSSPKEDFSHLTLRLGFVLILFILLLPWTSILIQTYKKNTNKETLSPRASLFSWFLKLDFILIISSFTLRVRNRTEMDQNQLLLLALGVSLAALWLSTGKLSTRKNTQHWLTWTVFYLLSILHTLYLAYVAQWAFAAYGSAVKVSEVNAFAVAMIILVCSGSSILTHLLTMLISCSLIRL